jgi:hypothetical protein
LQGKLSELVAEMPRFTRADFTYGNALNEFLDLILREPEPDDDRRVPVATVSKRYGLIQHSEAIEWLCEAYSEQKWDPSSMPATAWLSEYGERLRVQVATPHVPVRMAESDVIRASLFLWNSVDRSRSFELAINWVRLICTNGLTIDGEDRLRKVHNADWMYRTSAVEFLRERLPRSADKAALLREWLKVKVPATRLLAWVDGDLARKWGKVRAARVLHIVRTGRDGAVGRSSEAIRASDLHVSPLEPVPGAPPDTTDAYHIYQALLWIAGREVSIERQESLTDEAQRLVSPLVLAASSGA